MYHSVAADVPAVPDAARQARRMALLALACAALVAACAKGSIVGGNTKQMPGAQATDGFLPHPELLEHNAGTMWDLTYMKPGLSFSDYHAIYLAPVAVMTSPTSALAGLPQDQRDKLANTFYSDAYTAVEKSCNVAAAPGPGVIQLNFALSDAVSSDGVTKTVASYVPYVNIAYKASSMAFNNGVGYFSGTASAEGYATDGATGALLWQGVDRRGGNTPLLQNTTDKWLDVHHAFEAWSGQLVTRLQQLGICKPPAAAPS
jgi:hypothetical protein